MAHRKRGTDVWRIALACAVGVLSVAAAVALAVLLAGGAPPAGSGAGDAVARATPGAASLSPERAAHGASVPGMSEHQLRQFEIATLGPAHAREHAQLRRALRRSHATRRELGPSHPIASVAAAGPASEVGEWDPSATVTFPVVAIHA